MLQSSPRKKNDYQNLKKDITTFDNIKSKLSNMLERNPDEMNFNSIKISR